MKKILSVTWFLLCSIFALSQPFGNEWIHYSQKYYRFPVFEDGVYRITYQDLTAAGIPASLIDPSHIQLFAFAEEVPLYIHGGSDGVFNSGDYIEFVGFANDGRREAGLYTTPDAQGNPDYSLFNDTIQYFFTISNTGGNLRYSEVSDTNYAAYAPQEFLWVNSKIVFSNRYYDQPQLLDNPPANNPNFRLSLSEFVRGEGWLSNPISLSNPVFNVNVPTPAVFRGSGAPAGRAVTTVVGVSDLAGPGNDHFIQVKYGSAQTIAASQQFNGYQIYHFDFNIPNTALGDAQTLITHQVVNGLGVVRDDQAIAKTEIRYPRQTDLGGLNSLVFEYAMNFVQAKSRFDLQNISGGNPRIYTGASTPARAGLVNDNGTYKVLLSNSFDQDTYPCYLVTDDAVKSVAPLSLAGNNGYFTHFGQTQLDSAFVIVTHKSLMAEAQQYASYRQQRFHTVLADVDELYCQFGFGVEKSGLGLRNFARYILQTWESTPQYLLLLGKDIRSASIGQLAGTRKNPALYAQCLVPSLGAPPSDNFITAGLGGTTFEPALRTGRISARTPEVLSWYLDKLQTFEAQPADLWMKNVMHFGGGNNTQEQNRFANHLAAYATVVQDSSFGGIVHTFLKSSSEPIQINESEELSELIENQGVSLMTFFGHAGSEGFDQTIDNPENFNWNGKYPLLLGLGCYSGDYHGTGNSTSEQYTLLQGKGVIGFLASSDLGIEGDLHAFSLEFYKQLALERYGHSIGDQMKYALSAVAAPTVLRKYMCYDMGLQGDPGVVLNSFPWPDLEITPQDIFFTPSEITAEIDSFSVHVAVTNNARATNQPFNITLEHHTPEGIGDTVYVATMNGLYNRDTIAFRIPVDILNGLGLHLFNIYVDLPENTVRELNGFEQVNNQVNGKELYISNGGIVPVYPYKYAVISEPNPSLIASTGNPLAPLNTYRIEIDTTDQYNSPLLQSTEITQNGGVIDWQPDLNYPDSIVYFWRTREMGTDAVVWRESSFQYIPEKKGWGQSHFFQFKNDNFFQTEYNRPLRKIDFNTGSVVLVNNVIGSSASYQNNILLNTYQVEYGACTTTRSLHLAVIDPITFQAWGTNFNGENPGHDFGNANTNGSCRQRVEYYFIFRQNQPAQMQALADLLLSETIPDGYYVVLYSLNNVTYDTWDATPDIYTAVQSLGASIVGSPGAQDSVPFSLIVRKGDPSFVHEMYGTSATDVLTNSAVLPASGSNGIISTGKIGPAKTWKSASWRLSSSDSGPGDQTEIRLLGITPEGIETPIPGASSSASAGSFDLGALINAEEYPWVRFEAHLSDPSFLTPAQIRRWHVLYDEVPEAAVDPNHTFLFQNASLQQGQQGKVAVAIANVSDVDMDSLLVEYWIEDVNRNRVDIAYPRQDSLRSGQILADTVSFDTRYLTGQNVFWMEVNPPSDKGTPYDQPEQTHFNNVLQIPFNVTRDEENPLLDVTFDGIHIINGEIVSPRPEILISLKDENPFLLMNEPSDTSLFRVFLGAPQQELKRVYFGSGTAMQFIPAEGNKNRAGIIFKPQLTEDGTYKLLVQASDKSGNNSGNYDYQIDFEVVNKSSISEVLNYPNPFSTSTQFIFTLTGSEVPTEFKIQIMTVSGKVVREILQDEIGPLRIGRNFSQYRWDGRDQFGDQLANGVYLYRVVANINGQAIEKRDNGASKYFTRGFGKMVLLR